MSEQMFCYQCQETAANRGCNRVGLCGKTAEVSNLQDLLLHATKALACVSVRARKEGGQIDAALNHTVTQNLCATSTNVNFDAADLKDRVKDTLAKKQELLEEIPKENWDKLPRTALFTAEEEEYDKLADEVGVLATEDEDVRSLRALATGGVKGLAAFLSQINSFGVENEELDDFVQRVLVDLQNDAMTGGNLLSLVMEIGRYSMKAMELLDSVKKENLGKPEITKVSRAAKGGAGILVSGDDLRDLQRILEATKDSGVNVYTHGELLVAHSYPELKKYSHLAGHLGGSWWKQKEDFEDFGGPVIVTAAGIIPPKDSYAGSLYTMGAARYPGLPHLESGADGALDLTAVLAQAKEAAIGGGAEGELVTGYGCDNIFQMAEPLAKALKEGEISKFVVVAGADGRAKTRSYYEDFVRRLPEDTVILTAGSVKDRFAENDFGTIGEIPRLMDAGAIADMYSLIEVALKLGEAYEGAGTRHFPIVYNIAWYDQKSLAALLALFYLDIKNVHLGPTMPGFLTSTVSGILTKYFGVAEIGTPDHDIERLFGAREDLIRGDMIVAEIVQTYPQLVPTMMGEGLHCISCGVSEMETLDEACRVHGLDTNDIIELLNDTLANTI